MFDRSADAGTTRHWLAVGLVAFTVLAAVALVMFLPPSTRHLLIGRTVEHCPDAEISCPGQTLGLLHGVLFIAVPLLIYFEEDESDG